MCQFLHKSDHLVAQKMGHLGKLGHILQSTGIPIVFATPCLAFVIISLQPIGVKRQMGPFWKLKKHRDTTYVEIQEIKILT